jgi:hypothetical protein
MAQQRRPKQLILFGEPTVRRSADSSDLDVVGEDDRLRLFRLGKTILVSFGVAERRTGVLLGMWLKQRADPAGILAALQFARDHNVAEPVAYVSAIINGKSNGTSNKKSLSEIAARLASELRAREAQAELG